MELAMDLRSRQQVRDLIKAAAAAQEKLRHMDQKAIDRIVEAMARAGCAEKDRLARMAVEETGFGNAADKAEKNRFASEDLWKAVKDIRTVGILHRDPVKKVWDVAVPVGIIGAIVPSTNPTSTVIYKAIIALKGGNAIVFSPHPGAKACTVEAARLMAQAAEEAGCPKGAIGCITMPAMDAVQELMRHQNTARILATGGSAMVKAAYASGTPAIGVGAGNGPAYLHPSCELRQAVADIVRSKTFDNGTVCASEQSVIVHRSMAKEAEAELIRQGGCILSEEESKRLAAKLFRENGTMNPKLVGRTASQIAKLANLGEDTQKARVLLARETDAGLEYPYSMEKLCPVLGLFTVENEEEALALSCRILNHEGSGHTFAIHCTEQSVIERFAMEIPVSRFLVNTPAALGGIGATTGLFPAFTLGCGAVGGSSSSNNIGPLDLIDLRRVAWGNRAEAAGHTTITTDEALLDLLAEKLMQKLM